MGKASKDLVSVVVPIYNVEKYIKRCVDSIINQTYKNLDIILVDDESPDNCPGICEDYAKKDKRITVIHKQNGGLSDARNFGIKAAKGEFITFVDSDDFLSEECIETLLKNIKRYSSDISIGGHQVIYENGKLIKKYTEKEFDSDSKGILDKILYDDGIDLSAWAKLYKRSLFKNIRYPVGRLYEDAATTYKLIDLSNKVSVISKPVYYYVIRKDSITNVDFSPQKMDLIISTKEMTSYVQEKYPELEKGCNRRLMYAYLSTITQLSKSRIIDNKIKKELMDYVKNNRKKVLIDKRAPKRDKIGILSLCFGFNFFRIVWNIYDKNRGERNE